MTRYVDIQAARGDAGPFEQGYPMRIVLHTTETGDSRSPTGTADPERWIPGWIYPSHQVWDFERDTVYRVLPLDRAGKALYNAPGGVSTNTLPCIQIEINGFAGEAAGWSQDKKRWLADRLSELVEQIKQLGYTLVLDPSYQVEAGAIPGSAKETAPQRMSFSDWNKYNGLCGHRHVPENDHWDAGGLDLRELAALMGSKPEEPKQEEDDMKGKLFRVKDDNKVWFCCGAHRRHVPTPNDLTMLGHMGVVDSTEPTVLNDEIGLRVFKIVED